jgi:hypothetical protein
LAGGGLSSSASRVGNSTVISVGNAAQGAKFAACMRTHGVPNFPDPNAQGMIQFGSATGIDPHSPKFSSAVHACQKLLPHGLGPPTAAQLAQVQQQLLAFSKCMRAHGITDFPDPQSNGDMGVTAQPGSDLAPNNPQFQSAQRACQSFLPGGAAGPPQTSASGGGGR